MASMRTQRRHILLLEVLIAFAIIVLCIFPLIYPHVAMAKSQREFIKKIELDHVVTLLFSQIYQDLQSNKISWQEIESKKRFELSPLDLRKQNRNKSLPFKGYYFFEEEIHKPKAQTPQESTAYIFNLVFRFYPQYENKQSKLGRRTKNFMEYRYKIFILRDLRANKEPVKEETENKTP